MQFSPATMKLGKTLLGTQLDLPTAPNSLSGGENPLAVLAGTVATFKVTERVPDSNGFRAPIGSLEVTGILVENASSGELKPGDVVNWDDTAFGRKIENITGTSADDLLLNAGVVDPYLNENVRDGDFFWLLVKGVTFVRTDAAQYSVGTPLKMSGSTAGALITTGTTLAATDKAVSIQAKTTTSGDPYLLAVLNFAFPPV